MAQLHHGVKYTPEWDQATTINIPHPKVPCPASCCCVQQQPFSPLTGRSCNGLQQLPGACLHITHARMGHRHRESTGPVHSLTTHATRKHPHTMSTPSCPGSPSLCLFIWVKEMSAVLLPHNLSGGLLQQARSTANSTEYQQQPSSQEMNVCTSDYACANTAMHCTGPHTPCTAFTQTLCALTAGHGHINSLCAQAH